MPVNVDLVRELAARHEGPFLDFKKEQYEWPQNGNYELAKDLISMANGLSPEGQQAYILIGVTQNPDLTGRIVGVNPDVHLDDASMQQKVSHLLNCTPKFLYPFRSEAFGPGQRSIILGEDTFSLALYELLEQIIRFAAARDAL